MKSETVGEQLRQFGIRHLLLLAAAIAIVLSLRNYSIRSENERWVQCAPIIGAALISGGYRMFGTRNWHAIVAGTLFAFLASVSHSLELINRSSSFAFLRRGKIDLSSDPFVNAIVITLTSVEAFLAACIMVVAVWACKRPTRDAV